MSGFVGTRARKRKRQLIYYTIFFIICILIILYLPFNDFTSNKNPKPDDNILPDLQNEENINTTTVEDLQLMNFQKEQKIKFRDGRIISLKSEVAELKNDYAKMKLKFESIEKKYNDYIESQNSKKTIEVDPKKITNMQNELNMIQNKNKENNLLIQKLESDLNKQIVLNKIEMNDNSALKAEYKKIISTNIKLDNLIENLELIIENQKKEINKLKDLSHHNQ